MDQLCFTCMDIRDTWNETQTATSWRTALQGLNQPWLQLKVKSKLIKHNLDSSLCDNKHTDIQ